MNKCITLHPTAQNALLNSTLQRYPLLGLKPMTRSLLWYLYCKQSYP